MYHIVASDMDGTLLGTDHKLSPYTKETLQQLTAQGVNFVFATGRHYIDIKQIRQSLGIPAFMITSNGARIHGLHSELIFSKNLPSQVAEDLAHIAYHDETIQTHIYTDEEWFTPKHYNDAEEFFQESVFSYRLFEKHQLAMDNIAKVYYCSDSKSALAALQATINERWCNEVNACFSTPNCLEVMAAGVSKGHALAIVSEKLGLQLDHCIAFGDGMNDVEMLSMAKKGCIMQNADQRVKKALPAIEVIGLNSDNAVAHYLRQLYNLIP